MSSIRTRQTSTEFCYNRENFRDPLRYLTFNFVGIYAFELY